jgi:hypothetical protein
VFSRLPFSSIGNGTKLEYRLMIRSKSPSCANSFASSFNSSVIFVPRGRSAAAVSS